MSKTILHPSEFHTQYLQVGDLQMHLALEGEPGAPLVVLLHGFPEFWYSWRYQIKALAAAGYRVAAPDQRGYNLTDKKPPYSVFTLTADIAALIKSLGYEKAVVVGHDWGGNVAWLTAAFYPEVVERLIVCNCPHPAAMVRVLRSPHLPQLFKSWYVFFFQLPGIPEGALSRNNYATLASSLKSSTTKEERVYFREAWAQPGALSAGISWYRALVREIGKVTARDTHIRVPTRLIWGAPDPFLDKKTAEESVKVCDSCDLVEVPGAGHFVQQSMPEDVNRLILGFLKKDSSRAQS